MTRKPRSDDELPISPPHIFPLPYSFLKIVYFCDEVQCYGIKMGIHFFFLLFFSFLLAFPCKQAGRLEKRYEESNFSHFSRYLFSQEFANRVSILRRKCLLETKAHRARIEAPYIFKQWIDVFEIARRPRS